MPPYLGGTSPIPVGTSPPIPVGTSPPILVGTSPLIPGGAFPILVSSGPFPLIRPRELVCFWCIWFFRAEIRPIFSSRLDERLDK